MPVINTVSDLRSRFGFDDSNDALNNALAVSASSATDAMTVLMRTEFEYTTGLQDIFVPRSMIRNGELYEVRLKLSQGFVDPGSVVVVYAPSIADLQGGNTSAVTPFFIDANKGVITICDRDFVAGGAWDFRRLVPGQVQVGPGFQGVYIQVTYNAGFQSSDGVYTNTPDWLVNAAAARALVDLDESYPAYRADRAATPPDLNRRKDRIAKNLIRHIRYVPNAELPIGA